MLATSPCRSAPPTEPCDPACAQSTPWPSGPLAHARRHTTTLNPPLGPAGARVVALCPTPTPPSPAFKPPRLALVAAAVQPRRRPYHSKLRPKSSQGNPLVVLRPRPAGPGRRFAGIWPDHRRPVLGDCIAESQFFLRA
jgi:hypothetical protein